MSRIKMIGNEQKNRPLAFSEQYLGDSGDLYRCWVAKDIKGKYPTGEICIHLSKRTEGAGVTEGVRVKWSPPAEVFHIDDIYKLALIGDTINTYLKKVGKQTFIQRKKDIRLAEDDFNKNLEELKKKHDNKEVPVWPYPFSAFILGDIYLTGYFNGELNKNTVRIYNMDTKEYYYRDDYEDGNDCSFDFRGIKKFIESHPSNIETWGILCDRIISITRKWK